MQLVGTQQGTGDNMHTGHRRSRAEKEGKQHRSEQFDQPLQVLQAQNVSSVQLLLLAGPFWCPHNEGAKQQIRRLGLAAENSKSGIESGSRKRFTIT